MKHRATLAAALLLGAGSAFAQVIELSPQQETRIYSTLSTETVGVAPAEVELRVGATLPAEVELREVPATIEIPAVRRYRYTVIGGRVVLVDPDSRRVVRVIERR
jgi:hypothetical protein